jgi:long-chain acyl-CoA synthetase
MTCPLNGDMERTVTPILVTQFLENQLSDRTAIVDKMGEYTYAEINLQAENIAKWLTNSGVKTGERVVLCGINSSRLVAALFGILKVDAVIVPLHPDSSIARFQFVIQDCLPTAIIIDCNFLQTHAKILHSICKPILLISDETNNCLINELNIIAWSDLPQYSGYLQLEHISQSSLAAIIYTSGSSKDPRGVMLPHHQVVFVTTAINTVIGNCSEDVILCGLPLSFDYGLYQIFLTFQVGAKLVLEPSFNIPMMIPRLINDHGVTGFPGVPSIFSMLLRSRLLERANLPSLRYITSTGDVLPISYIKQLQQLLPNVTIIPMYGLTECKRVSIMPQNQLTAHMGSVGLPLPGTSVSIIDETEQIAPPGIIGELTVRGPHIMDGYWNNPEETAKRFRIDNLSGELVLHTGDNFYIDSDGFLYFVGRGEMFIKSRGHKISPIEIETVIYKLDGVVETAIIGVPDAIYGESICAFVSLANPELVDISEIKKYCKNYLPIVAQPFHIVVMKSLPKTINGKIDRTELYRLALEKTGLKDKPKL